MRPLDTRPFPELYPEGFGGSEGLKSHRSLISPSITSTERNLDLKWRVDETKCDSHEGMMPFDDTWNHQKTRRQPHASI